MTETPMSAQFVEYHGVMKNVLSLPLARPSESL